MRRAGFVHAAFARAAFARVAFPRVAAFLLVAASALLGGCFLDMRQGARLEPYAADPFFPDSMSARPIPANTVARETETADAAFFRGIDASGDTVSAFPVPVTAALLARGRERFDAICSPCHDRRGEGHGMIVQRGFMAPPSYDEPRLRAAPVGHFFAVITNGYGSMYSYAARVTPADRWAIVAYIRALQLSRNATLADLDPAERARLGVPGGAR